MGVLYSLSFLLPRSWGEFISSSSVLALESYMKQDYRRWSLPHHTHHTHTHMRAHTHIHLCTCTGLISTLLL